MRCCPIDTASPADVADAVVAADEAAAEMERLSFFERADLLLAVAGWRPGLRGRVPQLYLGRRDRVGYQRVHYSLEGLVGGGAVLERLAVHR